MGIKDRLCGLCGGRVRVSRHVNGGAHCSKKCEIEWREIQKVKELEFLKDGINAVGYKDFARREGSYRTSVIIGDTHFPFHSQKVLNRIIEIIAQIKPVFVVQIGDLYDFFSQSKYPRTHRLMTPQEEIKKGREAAEQMWADIHKASMNSKKLQILGNHDLRPYKRLLEKAPELEPFFQADHLFNFPQVETVYDSRQELVLDGVCYQHGHRKHGDHIKSNLTSTVHGHTHRAGIIYMKLRNELIWEFDVGMTADIKSVPLGYGPQTWNQCTTGVGIIDEHGPRFIPIEG